MNQFIHIKGKKMKEKLLSAWEKYHFEFEYDSIKIEGAFYEFESEMLYSLIRLMKPKFIIEMSPDKGFTTKIMINACSKNKTPCKLYSFDLHDKSRELDIEGNIFRKLLVGDVTDTLTDSYLKQCDFMFIDSNHSKQFGYWYATKVLPLLNKNTLIWIHDWEQGTLHNEPMAVKECFLDSKLGEKILNCTEILKERGNPYDYVMKNNRRAAISPSQILIRR